MGKGACVRQRRVQDTRGRGVKKSGEGVRASGGVARNHKVSAEATARWTTEVHRCTSRAEGCEPPKPVSHPAVPLDTTCQVARVCTAYMTARYFPSSPLT